MKQMLQALILIVLLLQPLCLQQDSSKMIFELVAESS